MRRRRKAEVGVCVPYEYVLLSKPWALLMSIFRIVDFGFARASLKPKRAGKRQRS